EDHLDDRDPQLIALRQPWTDRQASRRLGAVARLVLAVIVLMVVFVAVRAWPTLHHNGIVSWLGPGGSTDKQLGGMVSTTRPAPPPPSPRPPGPPSPR